MLNGTLRRVICLLAVGLIAAQSIGLHSAAVANVRHTRHAYVSHAYANHPYALTYKWRNPDHETVKPGNAPTT
jgi:hypothetical protein